MDDDTEDGRQGSGQHHDGGVSRGALVGGDDGEVHAAAAVPCLSPVPAFAMNLVIAAGDIGAEGRARDIWLDDGGSYRGALVAGDDGEAHAEAAVPCLSLALPLRGPDHSRGRWQGGRRQGSGQLHDGGDSHGSLVAGDDGEVHAEAAAPCLSLSPASPRPRSLPRTTTLRTKAGLGTPGSTTAVALGGHSSPVTTARYTRRPPSTKMLGEAMMKILGEE